jgi:hypothetical protein
LRLSFAVMLIDAAATRTEVVWFGPLIGGVRPQ